MKLTPQDFRIILFELNYDLQNMTVAELRDKMIDVPYEIYKYECDSFGEIAQILNINLSKFPSKVLPKEEFNYILQQKRS